MQVGGRCGLSPRRPNNQAPERQCGPSSDRSRNGPGIPPDEAGLLE